MFNLIYSLEILGLSIVLSIGFSFIISVITSIIEEPSLKFFRRFAYTWYKLSLYSIPISIIAYVAGYLTVYSRTSAITNVIPAVLALVGGLNIYVFGSESRHKALVGYCVCLFAIMLFLGTQGGAYRREAEREFRMVELARQELKIRTFRENLDLPSEPPTWILGTEPK
jgi:hypothetical protein